MCISSITIIIIIIIITTTTSVLGGETPLLLGTVRTAPHRTAPHHNTTRLD